MTSRPLPYVGVSGLVDPAQRAWLTGWFHALGFGTSRALLLGVKATHKTQYLDVENRYGRAWYPVGDEFTGALAPAPSLGPNLDPPRVLAVAQAYLEVDYVDDSDYRHQFTSRIVERGAGWLTGIQFDLLPWHTARWAVDFLADLRDRTGLQILLQCHDPAMRALGPDGVANRLATLAPSLDYVLFDSSHGTGTPLDATRLSRFLDAAHQHSSLDVISLGVAGGLSARTVAEDLPALLTRYPNLSFDAEGALHPQRGDGGRPLDLLAAADYLRAAARTTRHVKGAA